MNNSGTPDLASRAARAALAVRHEAEWNVLYARHSNERDDLLARQEAERTDDTA